MAIGVESSIHHQQSIQTYTLTDTLRSWDVYRVTKGNWRPSRREVVIVFMVIQQGLIALQYEVKGIYRNKGKGFMRDGDRIYTGWIW